VDKEWLAAQLEAGRSIGAIAREIGRDPSTVSYWVKKFGLRSRHAEVHAARGAIDRETLARLVSHELSSREIAQELGRSQSTVRHWLKRYALKTHRASVPPLVARIESECPTHGRTIFVRRGAAYACAKCRADGVTRWRRQAKQTLIREAGGCCVICGYDRCVAGLHFHHVDPATKRFGLGSRGLARAIHHLRAEAAKCVLLCSNCHAEVESGIATLPVASESSPG
jgi:transposase-like protein